MSLSSGDKMFKILLCCVLILELRVSVICTATSNENGSTAQPEDVVAEEIEYLSDLPLDELIRIKKSLNALNIIDGDDNQTLSMDANPDALSEDIENTGAESLDDDLLESRALPASGRDISSIPLVGGVFKKFLNKTSGFSLFGGSKNRHSNSHHTKNSNERSYEHYEPEPASKIETIFQVSITGLSFLAFGGYLLCMIVQAIKSKGTTYYHPASTAVASLNNASAQPIKKIKVYRRSKRADAQRRPEKQRKATEDEDVVLEDMSASPSPDEMYGILKQFAEGYVKLIDT